MAATTFSAFFSLKSGKWGPWKGNGDLLGTQKLKKVPMGTRVPKWGPTWEQCNYVSLQTHLDISSKKADKSKEPFPSGSTCTCQEITSYKSVPIFPSCHLLEMISMTFTCVMITPTSASDGIFPRERISLPSSLVEMTPSASL